MKKVISGNVLVFVQLFHSFDLTWVPCSSSCAFAIWFAMHLLIVCLKQCFEISFSARFTKSTEIGHRRPPLFTLSDSFICLVCSNLTLFTLIVPVETPGNCISSNSQTHISHNSASIFVSAGHWQMGSSLRQEIKVHDISYPVQAKTLGKKVEQGGNVQVSRYFNLQVISNVVTMFQTGHIWHIMCPRDTISGSHRGNSIWLYRTCENVLKVSNLFKR